MPNARLSQMLEGQILGLGTLEYSSDPGNAGVYKYVRGISSNQGTQPLFVVDGIVMQDYNYEFLTAAEIENIVVLKDAAATAIYGLKGANGGVVINTKSGLPGAFDVRVTADFSLQQIARKPETTSSYEYATLRNQAWANDGSLGAAPFSDDQVARISLPCGRKSVRVQQRFDRLRFILVDLAAEGGYNVVHKNISKSR